MSPVSSPSSQTQSATVRRLRVLRIGLVAVLFCLGAYAVLVAWDQFGPKSGPAKLIAARKSGAPSVSSPISSTATRPTVQSDGQPAAAATTANTEPAPTIEPTVDPVSAAPWPSPVDLTEPPADGEPNDAQPPPDAQPSVPPADSSAAPALAATLARLWEQSNQVVRDGIDRMSTSVEQLAAAEAKRQELLAQQQPATADAIEPAQPAGGNDPPEVKTVSSTSVLLMNPPDSGGVIHYVVDGATYSLHPGQMHQLDGEHSRRVEFHRGSAFGDASHVLSPGKYVFRVTENGWSLVEQTPSLSGEQ